ncbi:hypothetical protein ARMGADRAFT_1091204 [Armillaria gallica]|uniref:F-box domain-containing protein n=1 Tax=Armillaria gallica TaxID=47427 RepID=A0A2H3CET0_ARMGA|nr:hypothetical protein ARMGADRAFT_1091204 [Armillaria gallica]
MDGLRLDTSLLSSSYELRDFTVENHVMDAQILPLLRSGIPSVDLDATTLDSISTRIQLLDTERLPREKDMSTIQSLLNRLQLEHDRTVVDISRQKSIFSPFRRLPCDILLHIFRLAVNNSTALCLTSPPFIFRSVCYTWRTLVLSSSSLWSNVRIEITEYPSRSTSVHALETHLPLSTTLSLAGNCPLNMNIHGCGYTSEAQVLIAEYIAPTSHRWKSLYLNINDIEGIQRLADISGRLPVLESLDLVQYQTLMRQPFDKHLPKLFYSVPLLSTARIVGNFFRELSLPLHQLTTLYLNIDEHGIPESSLFNHCIEKGTSLVSFTFHYKLAGAQRLSEPVPEMIRPTIRRLSLGSHLPSGLKYCVFQGMEELVLFQLNEWEPKPVVPSHELTAISDLLKRSKIRLRYLAMYRPIHLSSLNNIAMTSITDLLITVNGETFNPIMRRLAEPSCLPGLQRLSLRNRLSVFFMFKDDSILTMVVSRGQLGLRSLSLVIPPSQSLTSSLLCSLSGWSTNLLQVYKQKGSGMDVTFSIFEKDVFADDDAVNEIIGRLTSGSER